MPAKQRWTRKNFWHDRGKSNLAQIVSATGVVIGFIGVLLQLQTTKHNAELAEARKVYMSYKDVTFAHPEFATPDLVRLKKDQDNFERYTVYVSTMLFAYDEVMTVDHTPRWNIALRSDLEDHGKYLCSLDRSKITGIHRTIQPIVMSFLNSNCNAILKDEPAK